MSREKELLDCPFCGTRPEYAVSKVLTSIRCCNDECPAENVFVDKKDKETAFKSWNTRAFASHPVRVEWPDIEDLIIPMGGKHYKCSCDDCGHIRAKAQVVLDACKRAFDEAGGKAKT